MHRIVIKTTCKPFHIFQNQGLLESLSFPENLEWIAGRFDYNSVCKMLNLREFWIGRVGQVSKSRLYIFYWWDSNRWPWGFEDCILSLRHSYSFRVRARRIVSPSLGLRVQRRCAQRANLHFGNWDRRIGRTESTSVPGSRRVEKHEGGRFWDN